MSTYYPSDGDGWRGATGVGSMFPWGEPTGTLYTGEELSVVSVNDENIVVAIYYRPPEVSSVHIGHRFKIPINESLSSITGIDVTAIHAMEGFMADLVSLRLFIGRNDGGWAWEQIADQPAPVNAQYYTQTGGVTTNLSQYIEEDSEQRYVHLLLFGQANDMALCHYCKFVQLGIAALPSRSHIPLLGAGA